MAQQELGRMYLPRLSLYLAYDYLPVRQQAEFLRIVNLVFENVLSLRDDGRLLAKVMPLCIEAAETGQSIEIRFGPASQRGLKWRFTTKGKMELLLPRWAGALMCAGTLIAGAGVVAKGAEEIWDLWEKWRPAPDVNIPRERQLQEQQATELALYMERYQDARETEAGHRIDTHLHRFRILAAAPNIREVKLNQYTIKR
jgi:hypothetical protein